MILSTTPTNPRARSCISAPHSLPPPLRVHQPDDQKDRWTDEDAHTHHLLPPSSRCAKMISRSTGLFFSLSPSRRLTPSSSAPLPPTTATTTKRTPPPRGAPRPGGPRSRDSRRRSLHRRLVLFLAARRSPLERKNGLSSRKRERVNVQLRLGGYTLSFSLSHSPSRKVQHSTYICVVPYAAPPSIIPTLGGEWVRERESSSRGIEILASASGLSHAPARLLVLLLLLLPLVWVYSYTLWREGREGERDREESDLRRACRLNGLLYRGIRPDILALFRFVFMPPCVFWTCVRGSMRCLLGWNAGVVEVNFCDWWCWLFLYKYGVIILAEMQCNKL